MSSGAREGLLALGALGLVGLVGEILLRGPRRRRRPLRRNPRRRGNPWITMRGHHVLIDDEGRIERGAVPQTWRGVHVRDVSELERRWQEIDAEEEDCAATGGGRARATFRSQDEALRALYDANPHLSEFVELEAKGQSERAYQDWVKGGRRGPKPRRARGDGRFDAINEGLERRGARAVASWSEAVRAIVPPTKRWEDFAPRLPFLEDATGLRLNLPAPAEELELGGGRGAECEQLGEGARERLLEHARGGRLIEAAQDEIPF